MKKKHLIVIIILIFVISIAVRYWPILHKGFPSGIEATNLILARNLSLTNEYKIDNEKNVVLSSEIVKEQGIQSKFGSKLTPILYSKVFDIFGFNQKIPLYVTLILYGIISILLFLLVLRLFNIWVALLFGFIEIFSPLVLRFASTPGFYEWALLFFSIGLLFYLYTRKLGLIKLFFAGLFFGLASLCFNVLGISFIPFIVYDFWKNKSIKRIAVFILPFVLVWGLYLGPAYLEQGSVDNWYFSSEETTSEYMHLFPDPYTWHFERDAYVESIKGTSHYGQNEFLVKYGYPVSLKNRALMYFNTIISYPKGLFAQTILGGPILVFFLLVGAIYLYKNKKYLMQLFFIWGLFWYLILIIFTSDRWGHFTELQFPLILLISLGVYWAIQFILKQNLRIRFKYLLIFGFIIVLFLHLIQSDKWAFHENYLYSDIEETLSLVDSIEKQKDQINKRTDVIAVGLDSPAAAVLNWYTDFNYLIFNPNTIEKLLRENRLEWAFEQFNVTALAGYDKDLTDEIVKKIDVKIISDSQQWVF